MPGEKQREPFLDELWHRKADEEQAVSVVRDTKATDLYLKLEKQAEGNKALREATENLTQTIGAYADAVIRLSKHKKNFSDKPTVENADRARKIVHDSLIDAANQLSRLYKTNGLDNSWRGDIIGIQHRGQIGRWALSVARYLLGKDLTEEEINGSE
ncbi:MAG: hypothetical protein KBC81_00520 [Candidatus Pacebacteria bacterium]|nr:hypothetical protein [Candidatus Paceibacterota bacterium]